MAWPSPTTLNASKGFTDIFPYLNTVTHFWFGRMIAIAVFCIFFFGYLSKREDDYIGGFAVASYVTFVISLFFWVLNILQGLDFAIVIGITAVSSIILFVSKGNQ